MARNSRTPATGMARALENVASQADNSRDTAPATVLQEQRIARGFKFSPEVAAAIARLAYGVPEHWASRS